MKKRVCAAILPLLCFLCILVCPWQTKPTAASAESGTYACVCADDVFFYATRDEKRGLFLLPKTYFVKVLAIDGDYTKIEYLYDDAYAKKVTGYAKTDELTFVDYVPQTPYLYELLEVHYTIEDAFANGDDFLNQITVTCSYYGDYRVGSKTYCYVLRGDAFGYIPKPDDFSYPENTEYADKLAQAAPNPPADETLTQSESMPPAQIAILIVLCLLVPVLAALILKPPRRPPYEIDD